MGKTAGKSSNKRSSGGKLSETNSKTSRSSEHSSRLFGDDATIFMEMAQDLREEGNKLFQRKDYEGALLKFEKAIKLLPKNHIDVASLHCNLAACYMQMGPQEYHRAIVECNLALEVSPKYSKALLKRARCFEALNRLDLAVKDVNLVLTLEPNNLTALDFLDRIKKAAEENGIELDDKAVAPMPEVVVVREKPKKKKRNNKVVEKVVVEEKKLVEEKESIEEKAVVAEKSNGIKEEPLRAVKLVFGEDIRFAQIPSNCSLLQLRDIVGTKFPSLKAVLIKYKDDEGDLVTLTTLEELRWVEESAEPQGSVRLYIAEVNPEHEPVLHDAKDESSVRGLSKSNPSVSENGSIRNGDEKVPATYVDDWIVQFAQLFKNHVATDSDEYRILHELGVKLYSEALEDCLTSKDAQEIFRLAEEKFQEMTALALFNWGNILMSRARKRLFLPEDASEESILAQVKDAYEWAQAEYVEAGKRYEEALRVKPDFYEGLLALGKQQFEQAKLSWYYAIGSKVDLETWPSMEVLELFNKAEDNMEKGTELWEEMEEQRLKNLSKSSDEKILLQKMDLDSYVKESSTDEAAEQASNMRSQINMLWGTMLYERSLVEFKLGLPMWEDCLMAAVEKFKHAGASPSDIAVIVKNHAAHENAQEGLTFKVDEVVQAWNEMYDAKRWASGILSFRLEPLLRRTAPKLHNTLENL